MLNFQRINPKLVKVNRDGVFVGWLEKSSRKAPGIGATRYSYYSGIVSGRYIRSVTLKRAKDLIESADIKS
jgi:hypothetical protein